MRSELELVLKAFGVAEEMGWPVKDDRVKVNVLRKQLENHLLIYIRRAGKVEVKA